MWSLRARCDFSPRPLVVLQVAFGVLALAAIVGVDGNGSEAGTCRSTPGVPCDGRDGSKARASRCGIAEKCSQVTSSRHSLRPSKLCAGEWLDSPNGEYKMVLEPDAMSLHFTLAEESWEFSRVEVPGLRCVEVRQPSPTESEWVFPQLLNESGELLFPGVVWWETWGKLLFYKPGDIAKLAERAEGYAGSMAPTLAMLDYGDLVIYSGGKGLVRLWTSATAEGVKAIREDAKISLKERRELASAARCASGAHSCEACLQLGCGWCKEGRRCVQDEPRICAGPEDHVGNHGSARCEAVPPAPSSPSPPIQRREADATKTLNATDFKDSTEELLERARRAGENEGGRARPYEVLQVDRDAGPSEIRRAYRRLSLRLHPDKNSPELKEAATQAFDDLTNAYSILGTPDKRAIFDEAVAASGGNASFSEFESAWAKRGAQGDEDFYFGHSHISTLTDGIWETRVKGAGRGSIWMVELYAAWCQACRQFATKFSRVAETLENDDIDVGAVNCAKNPMICKTHLSVNSIPTIVLLHPEHGTEARFDGQGKVVSSSAEDVVEWARRMANEWRWLYKHGRIHHIGPDAWETGDGSNGALANSTELWVVVFTDGFDCGQCVSARTNLLRLSASMVGLPVSCGLVNCAAHRNFCHHERAIPSSPFRPTVRLWARGPKVPDDPGIELFNANELEPHVALRILDGAVRAALAPELIVSTALSEGGLSDFADERPKEPEEPEQAPGPPPYPGASQAARPPGGLLWDGVRERSALPGRANQGGSSGGRQPQRPQLQR